VGISPNQATVETRTFEEGKGKPPPVHNPETQKINAKESNRKRRKLNQFLAEKKGASKGNPKSGWKEERPQKVRKECW